MTTVRTKEHGSILLLALVLMLLIGGLCGALYSATLASHRASVETLERELAYRCAESGVAHVFSELSRSRDFLERMPAFPSDRLAVGDGSYFIRSASEGSSGDWQVVVTGVYGESECNVGAAFGARRIPIPPGVVTSGTGRTSDVTCSLSGPATIASYDSGEGSFDPLSPGDAGNLEINGRVSLSGSVTIHGDVEASGTIATSGGANIAGEITPNAGAIPIDDIDAVVYDILASSRAGNDNGVLTSIFGSQWQPLSTSENYGNLLVTSGTHRVPAGTYRFKRFEVRNGATVIFDTSTGPVHIAYIGSGDGTGSLNDIIVEANATVCVDSGDTTNGLLTILGVNCDMTLGSNARYGQNLAAPESGGYTQVISMGGDASSDGISLSGGARMFGRLYAVAHTLTLAAGSHWYGSLLARSVSVSGSASAPVVIAIDESAVGGALLDRSGFDLHARWHVSESAP